MKLGASEIYYKSSKLTQTFLKIVYDEEIAYLFDSSYPNVSLLVLMKYMSPFSSLKRWSTILVRPPKGLPRFFSFHN